MTDVDDILALVKADEDALRALAVRDAARTARIQDLLDQIANTAGSTLTAEQVTAAETQLKSILDMANAAAPTAPVPPPPAPLPGPFAANVSKQPPPRPVPTR